MNRFCNNTTAMRYSWNWLIHDFLFPINIAAPKLHGGIVVVQYSIKTLYTSYYWIQLKRYTVFYALLCPVWCSSPWVHRHWNGWISGNFANYLLLAFNLNWNGTMRIIKLYIRNDLHVGQKLSFFEIRIIEASTYLHSTLRFKETSDITNLPQCHGNQYYGFKDCPT